MKLHNSHGDGTFEPGDFKSIGKNVIIEKDVKIFHPENIIIGNNVYIGHNTILKGYFKNIMKIGDNTWIGQNCFFHSAGGITIEKNVGIGPNTYIVTSQHELDRIKGPILHQPLKFAHVTIEEGSDIGISTTILPGVIIEKFAQVGAMSLVNRNVAQYCLYAGVPAKFIKKLTTEQPNN